MSIPLLYLRQLPIGNLRPIAGRAGLLVRTGSQQVAKAAILKALIVDLDGHFLVYKDGHVMLHHHNGHPGRAVMHGHFPKIPVIEKIGMPNPAEGIGEAVNIQIHSVEVQVVLETIDETTPGRKRVGRGGGNVPAQVARKYKIRRIIFDRIEEEV